MSLLIKGMGMPKNCRHCEFRHLSLTQFAFCTVTHETIDCMTERTKRLDDCPLVPVQPHGRLIDADVLGEKAAGRAKRRGDMVNVLDKVISLYDIETAPTIIPAEEGER